MDTSNEIDEHALETVKERNEDYVGTIQALQAFISCVTFDDATEDRLADSYDGYGRAMSLPGNADVTPDAVIQRDAKLGYLVEAKKSLPKEKEFWKETLAQLQKYDQVDKGWWSPSEKINEDCVVLLIHQSRGLAFNKFLDEKGGGGSLFRKKFSIVRFNRSEELKPNIFLEKVQGGQIDDTRVNNKLEVGHSIPILKVLQNPKYGTKKFLDAAPLEEYIMHILWNGIFTDLHLAVQYNETEKAWPLKVNVVNLTEELQLLNGSGPHVADPRAAEFPKTTWIRKALDAFVVLDLARKDSQDAYTVLFKQLPIDKDIIEIFSSFRAKRTQRESEDKDSKQIDMFKRTP